MHGESGGARDRLDISVNSHRFGLAPVAGSATVRARVCELMLLPRQTIGESKTAATGQSEYHTRRPPAVRGDEEPSSDD